MRRRQFMYAGLLSFFGINLSNSSIYRPKKSKLCGTRFTFRSSHDSAKWGKSHLTYYTKRRDTSDMSRAEWDNSWAAAFRSWSDVCPITFMPTATEKTADIVLDGSQDKGEGFGERGEILAGAELPSTPDWSGQLLTKFDKSEEWVVKVEDEQRDILLRAVAAHEIGHLLGLDHSFYDSALMYPYYSPHIWQPQPVDDIPRIQELYFGENVP